MIMMQSASGAAKINDQDHAENADEKCYKKAKLKVQGSATNLADLDAWAASQSDPYMEVIATDVFDTPQKLKTPHRGGTHNPTWGDYLIFDEKYGRR